MTPHNTPPSITLLSSLLITSALTGCALFEDLEKEGSEPEPIVAACADYCHAIIYAWDDCLDLWYTCGVTNMEESNQACAETCVAGTAGFTDEEIDSAVECIECYLQVYGETPSCWDVYLTDFTPCVDDCQDIDVTGLEEGEDWTEVIEDDCPVDEY